VGSSLAHDRFFLADSAMEKQNACEEFTSPQQDVLRNQVAAFKFFEAINKKVGFPHALKPEWMPLLRPIPLETPDYATLAVKSLSSDIYAYRAQVVEKIKAMKMRYDKARGKDLSDPSLSDPLIMGKPPLLVASNINISGDRSSVYSPHTHISRPHMPASSSTLLVQIMKTEYQNLMQEQFRVNYRKFQTSLTTQMQAARPGMSNNPGQAMMENALRYGDARAQYICLQHLQYQRALRKQIDEAGAVICSMNDKQYRAMINNNKKIRIANVKQEMQARADEAAARARDAKAYRQDIVSNSNSVRDLRVYRNKHIVRFHDKLMRARLKEMMATAKDNGDATNLRLDALKKYGMEAYKEMLAAQTAGLNSKGEKYDAICKFLADTEEYMHKLAGRIASVKMTAEASKAATAAIEDARRRGLTEEEVQEAAQNAISEAARGNDVIQKALDEVDGADAQKRYYQLAHSSTEEITEQPKLLCPPNGSKLREYQIVGLQWMISLYNNHLNGILADEMGLGKTVQVMALIAYLMEKKDNRGPHLIIVPNSVIVNWKSELTHWLPSARCVYYVGNKEDRNRLYVQEVQAMQFNILVTTYEFIMRDRAKLSKVDWQYIIIDEAQRMKDRESKLAKDLDKFRSARRLLLSGTPLQNELEELWSLLNLLLPDVFDDAKVFSDWFGSGQGKGNKQDEHWLDTEQRVIVVHRLHQILEPFMLRRQVEDVENKLPQKTTYTIHCPMSAHQSMTYSWVKATSTLRMDPDNPHTRRGLKWASLHNKCMELRKVCNHHFLSYPPLSWAVGQKIVRQCGKLVVLDKMLVKLKATGHKVLLFSTMTKLLDIMEEYLKWRKLPEKMGGGKMRYLRIDGATSLEDREEAMRDFSDPNSDAFIFLLSIRAAGRGLNLQTSDTVIVYDPDPNPKNEEQAVARSHRIGQTREVKVFHLEAITDNTETRQMGGNAVAGNGEKLVYGDSIESIVRNQIQTRKIAMANEVIDAGRFDQQTSMEERRHTLESMLQDPERMKKATNVAPSDDEINAMMARGADELETFRSLDADPDMGWMSRTLENEIPVWLKYGAGDLMSAKVDNSKHAVDIEAEIAALTGKVIHHHHAPKATKAGDKRPANESIGLPASVQAIKRIDTAEPSATVRSERADEDEDDVTVENDDEEEDIKENDNFIIDDVFDGMDIDAKPS
jgi:SWI/SNF-related matrix-associated actin-dependent regulator of chromatin subfamily A protein 2/4